MVAEEAGNAKVTPEPGVAAAAPAWMTASAEFPKEASAEAVLTAKEAEAMTTVWLEQARR